MAAKFPTAIATNADLLVAYDLQTGVLSAGVNDNVVAIPVVDAANFTGRANFIVAVDSELILIASVTGTTLNVATGGRGFAGTVAAAHLADAAVRGVHISLHHNLTADEVKAIETALGINLGNVCKNPLAANLDAGGKDINNIGSFYFAAGGLVSSSGGDFVFRSGTPAKSLYYDYGGVVQFRNQDNAFRVDLEIDALGNIIANLPTSSAGLPSKALWCDTANGRVVKQVA